MRIPYFTTYQELLLIHKLKMSVESTGQILQKQMKITGYFKRWTGILNCLENINSETNKSVNNMPMKVDKA